MDDKEDLRYIFTKVLNRNHYEVEVAEDGNEAIRLFKGTIGSNKPFDAVIMDLKVAGGMGGEEAIEKLFQIDCGTKIILSSGSIDEQVMKNFRKYSISDVLRKPFKNNDLVKVLRKVISEEKR